MRRNVAWGREDCGIRMIMVWDAMRYGEGCGMECMYKGIIVVLRWMWYRVSLLQNNKLPKEKYIRLKFKPHVSLCVILKTVDIEFRAHETS